MTNLKEEKKKQLAAFLAQKLAQWRASHVGAIIVTPELQAQLLEYLRGSMQDFQHMWLKDHPEDQDTILVATPGSSIIHEILGKLHEN